MTVDENDMVGADAAIDQLRAGRIKEAYNQVQLPEESFARMLATLSEASEARDANVAAGQPGVPTVHDVESEPKPLPSAVPATRRRPRVLRFVLPAAACLLVALIAGVVAFRAPMNAGYEEIAYEAAPEDMAAESGSADSGDAGAASTSTGEEYDYDQMYGDTEGEMLAPDASSSNSYGEANDEGAMDSVAPSASAEEGTSAKQTEGNGFARQFPRIELASGQTLQLVEGKGGSPQKVDASDIAGYLEDAKAYAPGQSSPAACVIYVTSEGSYAASFEGDSAYYLLESA